MWPHHPHPAPCPGGEGRWDVSEQDPSPERIDQRIAVANAIKPLMNDGQVFIVLLVTNQGKESVTHYVSNGERSSVYIHLRNHLKKCERDFQGGN